MLFPHAHGFDRMNLFTAVTTQEHTRSPTTTTTTTATTVVLSCTLLQYYSMKIHIHRHFS
jgi:hypothetical protein